MSVQDFYCPQANDGSFDLLIGNNLDFFAVQGFDTLFQYQLYVDRRGTNIDTSLPRQRGGWLADLATKQSGYESGSFLWTKYQSRNTQNDQNEVAAFAENALQYFVQAGLAKKVSATVNNNAITGTITVDNSTNKQFSVLWNNTGNPTS